MFHKLSVSNRILISCIGYAVLAVLALAGVVISAYAAGGTWVLGPIDAVVAGGVYYAYSRYRRSSY